MVQRNETDPSPQASGSLGAPVLNALIKSGKFNITAVKRQSSSASFPDSVTVRTADLSSVDSVTAAFKGQDAVVSTVGMEGLLGQSVMIEAAVAANVKRFLPSDFGSNLANPKTSVLPVFKYKTDIHKAVREAAAAKPDFTYTLVCNGAFLDWAFEKQLLLNWNESKVKLFDGGKGIFSATTLDSVGQAVVGVLSHPEETKNRFVYVKDTDISQNQVFDIVKKVDPGRTWEEPIQIDTADVEKSSYGSLAKGEITMPVMVGFIFRAMFVGPEYGSKFVKTDNELLGVKGKTEAEIEALFKSLINGSK